MAAKAAEMVALEALRAAGGRAAAVMVEAATVTAERAAHVVEAARVVAVMVVMEMALAHMVVEMVMVARVEAVLVAVGSGRERMVEGCMEEAIVVEGGTAVAQLETVMELAAREGGSRVTTVTEEALLARVTSEGAMMVVGPMDRVTMVVVRAVVLKEAVCQAAVTPVEVKMVAATWVLVEIAEVVGRVLA